MTDSIPMFTAETTAEQARDYFEWHVQNGRGKLPLSLDPRGLAYLTSTPDVRLALPLEGEGSHDAGRVFMRAVF